LKTRRSGGRPARWRLARAEALRRNPFCAICGTFKRLDVHHIIPYRLTKDDSQDNLIPLCRRHHRQVERLYAALEPVQMRDPLVLEMRRITLIGQQNVTRFVIQQVVEELNAAAA
jgi:5-methylcytosine-specific restriction endonuclease McrA